LSNDFLLLRYHPDGSPDSTFGIDGVRTTDVINNSADFLTRMIIQPDGKILICGSSAYLTGKDIVIMRFNTDGSYDTSFGINGRIRTDVNGQNEEARDIALQPDGKIVVAGYTQIGNYTDCAIFRYMPDGTPDTTFGSNGNLIVPVSTQDDACNAIAIDSTGNILVVGFTYDMSQGIYNSLIMRFDSSGNTDTTFGNAGQYIFDINTMDNQATNILIQPDEKLLLTGNSYYTSQDMFVARLNPDGLIDIGFGTNGIAFTDIGTDNDGSLSSILQPDGKIVSSGYYTNSGINNFALARYRIDSIHLSTGNISAEDFQIYPQPAKDLLHIRGKSMHTTKAIIYDMPGNRIKDEMTILNSSVDVSSLQPGLYIIELSGNGEKYFRKFMKGDSY
jgi:uncharacterized delta-60 repeat protein